MNKSILKAAVSTAAILFLLFLLFMLVWILNKNQPDLSYRRAIVAQEVPYQTTIESEGYHKILYPASVFNSNFVIASNNMRDRIKSENNVEDTSTSAKSVPCAAPSDNIPIQYTEIRYPNIDYPIYVFMDNNGHAKYRIYISRSEDGQSSSGYIQAQQAITNLKIHFDFDENDDFVDVSSEPFGEIELTDAPEELTVSLVKEYGLVGTYYRINNAGIKEYYVFGHYPNSEDEFYIADFNGHMVPGTLPVSIN